MDWSGNFKPWFNDGLYRKYWRKFDILNLSVKYGNAIDKKKTIEEFKGNRMNLIIGTTSINRPDLHNINMCRWIKYLNKTKDYFSIYWVLNVDQVPLLEFTYEETVGNYKKMLRDANITNIELIVLPKKEPGFLQSCNRISNKIADLIKTRRLVEDNTFVFWLEDDWKLNELVSSNVDLAELSKLFNDKSYLNLSFIRNNYFWALAPSLMKYEYFKNVHKACWNRAIENNLKDDPEHLLGKHFIKSVTKKFNDLKTVNIVNNQFKKIKLDYLNGDFFQKGDKRILILDKKYAPTFKYEKNIEFDDVKDYLGNDWSYLRITPGWCDGGVNFGRQYMEKKKIKKWGKGNLDCSYEKR